jgi:hypothetical protein
MLSALLLFSTLIAQQPAQQPAAKPRATATQQADTTKAKSHRRHARKAKPATPATAPRDTTQRKP